MAVISTLVVKLLGDIGGFSQTMGSAESVAETHSKGIMGHLSGIADMAKSAFSFALGGLITKGFDLVGDAIGGIKSAMIDGNAEFERYETQFGVLLGSTEAAKTRLAELADFGARTPFELPEVVRADKVLQAFGLHAVDAAARFGMSGTEIRTVAGDVAAGTGASFEEISTYLGKFSSGATGEAISRMQELGIVTRSQLQGMGLEFSKSGELLSPLDKSMTVLLSAMKEKYGGMMDAQSATFEGMVSNLQDWLGQTGRLVGQPIFDVLKTNLKGLLGFLGSSEVQAGLTSFAQWLAGAIQSAITFIGQAISWVQTNWPAIQAAIAPVIATVVALIQHFASDIVPQIVAAVGQVISWVQTNWPAIQAAIAPVIATVVALIQHFVSDIVPQIVAAVGQVISWVQTNWPAIQAAIEPVINTIVAVVMHFATEVLPQIIQFVGQVISYISEHWPQIYAEIKPVIEAVIAVISQLYETGKTILIALWDVVKSIFGGMGADAIGNTSAMATVLGDIWNSFKIVLVTALDVIQSVLKLVMDILKGDWEAAWLDFLDILTGAMNLLINVWVFEWNVIKAAAIAIWAAISSAWTAYWDKVTSNMKESLTLIANFLSNAWAGIKTEAIRIWNTVVAFFKDTWDGISKKISDTWISIKNSVSMTWETIKTWLVTAWDNIKRAAGDAWESIKQRISDTWESIKKFFTWDNLKQLGENIIKGIADGLSNAWGWLRDAATNVANAAINAFKNAFGIHSRSTVMYGLAGYLMQGLTEGIQDNADLPQIALDAAMPSAGGINLTGLRSNGSSSSGTTVHNYNVTQQYYGTQPGSQPLSYDLVKAMVGA